MRPHIKPARQESAGRGGRSNGLPLLFMLRRTRDRWLSCGGGFYRVAARSCTGLTRGVTLLYSTILLCWLPAGFIPANFHESPLRRRGPTSLTAPHA